MKKIEQTLCPPDPFPKLSFWGSTSIFFLILLILWHQREELPDWTSIGGDFKSYIIKPNMSSEVLSEIFWGIIDTVEVAFLGTLFGGVLALPLALLASDMGGSRFVNSIVRTFLAFIRSIPLIFYAYILVNCFGLGMVSGVLAVMIYSLGILSKQFLDEITNLDETVAHSIMSTGASRFQVFWHGLLPELLPNFLTFGLLRFEINIREATILGIVGAGGIGVLLHEYCQLPPYDRLWTLILFIFVVVAAIEVLCRWTVRKIK